MSEAGYISIPQAAPLMGLSRCQAWRRLSAIHAAFPAMRTLAFPCHDGGRRNAKVNLVALRRIILDEEGLLLQEVFRLIGILESDVTTNRIRADRLEKELKKLQKLMRST